MPLGRAPENPYHLYICIYVQTYASMHVCRRVQAHICCNVQVSWILMKILKEGEFSNFLHPCYKSLRFVPIINKELLNSTSSWFHSSNADAESLFSWLPPKSVDNSCGSHLPVRCEYLMFPPSLSFSPFLFPSSLPHSMHCRVADTLTHY